MPPPPTTKITLLDGGLGTTIAQLSKQASTSPLWASHLLIASPHTLRDVHAAFAAAGAEVIQTATYQSSFSGFAELGVGPDGAGNAMRSAVGLVAGVLDSHRDQEVRDLKLPDGEGAEGERKSRNERKRKRVCLSLGPYGATMRPSSTEYSGAYDEEHNDTESLTKWHAERLSVFSGHAATWDEVDMIAFETIPRVDEVFAVRRTMASRSVSGTGDGTGSEEESGERAFWISAVVPGDEMTLPDGSSMRDFVRAAIGEGMTVSVSTGRGGAETLAEKKVELDLPTAQWIGINCTRVSKVERLVTEMEAAVEEMINQSEVEGGEVPGLVLYPDGTRGEVYNVVTKEWELPSSEGGISDGGQEETMVSWAEEMATLVHDICKRGCWKEIIVGGCCRTMPEDIKALGDRLREIGLLL